MVHQSLLLDRFNQIKFFKLPNSAGTPLTKKLLPKSIFLSVVKVFSKEMGHVILLEPRLMDSIFLNCVIDVGNPH
jgi:hypothetical protein